MPSESAAAPPRTGRVARGPRSRQGRTGANSSGVLPLPNPTAIRPLVSKSATATCSATSSGWCRFRQMIAVPSRMSPGLASQMQREEQGRGQVPVMSVGVVLRKPGIPHAQLIGQPDQVGHLVKDRRRRLVSRSFKMVGQPDLKRCPRSISVPRGTPSPSRQMIDNCTWPPVDSTVKARALIKPRITRRIRNFNSSFSSA